jgi:hypothetical protein
VCGEAPVFAESILGGFQARAESARTFLWSARTPEWKLIRRKSLDDEEAHELYDLTDDPAEKNDLYPALEAAGSEEHEVAKARDAAGRLGALLDDYLSRYGGPDYWQDPVEEGPPPRSAVTELAAPPRILSPATGSRLDFDETGAIVAGEWTGSPAATYVVEYDVGVDHLRTSGEITVVGTHLEFGPAPLDIWNSLAQFNPWRFRVWLEGVPDKKSEWIQFDIEPG